MAIAEAVAVAIVVVVSQAVEVEIATLSSVAEGEFLKCEKTSKHIPRASATRTSMVA